MIRARFKENDKRPLQWPVRYPYWCTGYDSDNKPIIVGYFKDEEEIFKYWPEAQDIDAESVTEIVYTDRFPKPDWYKDTPND